MSLLPSSSSLASEKLSPFGSTVAAAPSSSPVKPRLLWRGSFQLPDRTILPGISLVSYVQPSFASNNTDSTTNNASSSSLSPSIPSPSSSLAPLTLGKEQQDELSLSIEMVRHAPITLAEVVEGVERDENGTMLKPRSLFASNPKENSTGFKVSYEAAGGIRMFVDPSHPSTLAYMERIFCYDDSELGQDVEEIDEKEQQDSRRLTSEDSHRSVKNVIVLSLDKSFRYSLTPSADVGDVFLGETVASTWQTSKTNTNGAVMEAVIMGIKVPTEQGTSLELHVGQKVLSKVASKAALDQRSTVGLPFGLRPDDPAPRGRLLSAKYRSRSQLLGSQLQPTSSSSPFISPSLPASRASFSGTSRPALSAITPKVESRSTSDPSLKRINSLDQMMVNSAKGDGNKRVKVLANKMDDGEQGLLAGSSDGIDCDKIVERNRSLIKKLVHHQLLGRGLEKNDADYLACFNPTCNGTVLALKKHFKTELIEKTQAAVIIEKHLDMYL